MLQWLESDLKESSEKSAKIELPDDIAQLLSVTKVGAVGNIIVP